MVTIVGHGIPDAAIQGLYDSATAFFAASHEEKMRHCLHQGYGKGGFVPQGVEAVARSTGTAAKAPADLVENFVFSHGGDPQLESVPVPPQPPGFQPAVETYWREATALLGTLMELSAVVCGSLSIPRLYPLPSLTERAKFRPAHPLAPAPQALGLPAAHFEPCFRRPKCNLRLAYYPAIDPAAPPLAGALRYGAHTDYTGFTILRQDPHVSGLEAQTADGAWHSVPPCAGGLVVNAGDLIQVWSNDRWRSPPHRVVNPPAERARVGRLSLVFFTGPADETVVEALPGTHSPNRPKRYPPTSARNHLLAKLQRSNV